MGSKAPADLRQYASHFDELTTEEHELVFNINAANPLSRLRDDWQNVTNDPSEYHLSTDAGVDDVAGLESEARGEYSPGFMCQAGIGVRVPQNPTQDSEMRWGYFDNNVNDFGPEPVNGFYFGVDSNGVFVARSDAGSENKVYQEDWNRDKMDSQYNLNPSGETLDLTDGNIYQIDFTYYGYGPIEMKVIVNDDDDDNFGDTKVITVHQFSVDNETSTKETGLPVRAEIDSRGTNSDALDLFVGGRKFSVVGKRNVAERTCWHYVDSLSVDDTAWVPAMSFKLKDGTDIGSLDFSHILAEVSRFYADTDSNSYKWAVRVDTEPDAPTWETPESHAEDADPNETAFKVDTASTSITDGSGNLTGVNVDGGVLAEGKQNVNNVLSEEISGQVDGDQTVSLVFKSTPGSSGTVSEILWKVEERW